MNRRRLKAMAAGAAGLLLYVGVFLDPALAERSKSSAELAAAYRELRDARLLRSRVTELEGNLERVRRDLSTRDGPAVTDALIRRIGRVNLTQKPEQRADGRFLRVEVNLAADADLAEIVRILHALTYWNEYFRLDGISVSAETRGLKMQLSGSTLLAANPVEVPEPPKRELLKDVAELGKYEKIARKNMFERYRPPPEARPPKPREPERPPPPRTAEIAIRGITNDAVNGRLATVEVEGTWSEVRAGDRLLHYVVKEVSADGIVLSDGKEEFLVPWGEEKRVRRD